MQLSLWSLLPRRRKPRPPAPPARAVAPSRRRGPAVDRYERMTRELCREHGVRVRKWRSSMSGVAWEVRGSDGSVGRLIESPRPRGPVSAAIFLHEIGHHAIGFNRYRPRCLEEYHAWRWALEEMERRGVRVTERVQRRVRDSLRYAVWKARRRGLRRLPVELEPFDIPFPSANDPG